MKKNMVLTLAAAAAFVVSGNAVAQTRHEEPLLQYIQYAGPVFTYSCAINGAVYGVDAYSRIWAQDAMGRWFVMGRIVSTPEGYIAVRNDGVRFPAACQ